MSAAGDKILGSIREARAILRGESAGDLVVHVPPEFDVKALRPSASASPRSKAGRGAAGPKARRGSCSK